jgi:hypothetical protein
MKTSPLSLLSLLLLSSCATESTQTYLFLGHPYQWQSEGRRVDYRVEALDLAAYDQIWLGGDVCAKTASDTSILEYLDSLFDFGSGRIHWALGNHDTDYGPQERIHRYSGLPEFYIAWQDRLCLLVLNTNLFQWPGVVPSDSVCLRMQAQEALVRIVSDTVQEASHLVVLHHYGLVPPSSLRGAINPDTIFNFYDPSFRVSCPDKGPTSTFENRWWPLFEAVQQRGVQVVFVAGDMGMQAKRFEWQTDSGVWFLGAGINNTVPDHHRPPYITCFDPDLLLIFTHKPASGKLSWHFEEL